VNYMIKDIDVAYKFIALKQSAKSRNIEFNLSLTSVKNLMKAKRCHYTRKELSNNNRSIDRIDNSKGYVKGNVCACTVDINGRKGNLSIKEIECLYKRCKEIR